MSTEISPTEDQQDVIESFRNAIDDAFCVGDDDDWSEIAKCALLYLVEADDLRARLVRLHAAGRRSLESQRKSLAGGWPDGPDFPDHELLAEAFFNEGDRPT